MDPHGFGFGPYDVALTKEDFAEMDQLLRDIESGNTSTTTFSTTTTRMMTIREAAPSYADGLLFSNTTYDDTTTTAHNDNNMTCFPDLALYSPQPIATSTFDDQSPASLTTLSSFTESPVFSEMDFDMGFDYNNNTAVAGFFPTYIDSMITGTGTVMMPPPACWEETPYSAGLQQYSSWSLSTAAGDMAASPLTSSLTEEKGEKETLVSPPPPPAADVSYVKIAGEIAPTQNTSNYSHHHTNITNNSSSSILPSSSASTTPASTSAPSGSNTSSHANHICPHCGSGPFPDITKFKLHTNKHTKPFRCTAHGCDDAFAEKKGLQRHLRVKAGWDDHHLLALEDHGLKVVKFACPHAGRGCTYMTIRDDNLKRHISTCSL